MGTGLPAQRQDVNGIPAGRPVPGDSPLFMGFKSGLRRNQATEDSVTIADGPCQPPHGPEFTATLCDLAAAVMGPEVAHVLRVVYMKEGVR